MYDKKCEKNIKMYKNKRTSLRKCRSTRIEIISRSWFGLVLASSSFFNQYQLVFGERGSMEYRINDHVREVDLWMKSMKNQSICMGFSLGEDLRIDGVSFMVVLFFP